MSSSRSQTQANQSTTQIDNRVAADGGSIVAGTGSSVIIENVSDEIARYAFDANREIARDGFDLAGDAIGEAHRASTQHVGTVLDFAGDFARLQAESTDRQRKAYDDNARRTTELIAAQAGVVSPASTERLSLGFGLGLLFLAGLALYVSQKKK